MIDNLRQNQPVYAVIVAAGRATRLAMEQNKPFLLLENIPVIIRTLQAFARVPAVAGIVLVARRSELIQMKALLEQYQLPVLAVVPGGKSRRQSVYRGLSQLNQLCDISPTAPVIVHDGARCMVSPELIERVIASIRTGKASALAVPAKDTVKLTSEDGVILSTPQRSTVWLMQTPQGALWQSLWPAYQQAENEQWQCTDDLSVLEKYGLTTHVVEGSYHNIKITTRDDWSYLNWLLKHPQ